MYGVKVQMKFSDPKRFDCYGVLQVRNLGHLFSANADEGSLVRYMQMKILRM